MSLSIQSNVFNAFFAAQAVAKPKPVTKTSAEECSKGLCKVIDIATRQPRVQSNHQS